MGYQEDWKRYIIIYINYIYPYQSDLYPPKILFVLRAAIISLIIDNDFECLISLEVIETSYFLLIKQAVGFIFN